MEQDNLSYLHNFILKNLAENPSWKFKTFDDFWLCPYCSEIAAHWSEPDKMFSEVLGHLKMRCKSWLGGAGKELSDDKLNEALEILNWLRTEGKKENFTVTDDQKRWYCPYCGERQKNIIDFQKPSKSKILSIIEHIESCQDFINGSPALNIEEMKIATQLRRDKRFRFYLNNVWVSPWTLNLTEIKLSEDEKITREQILATASHYQKIIETLGDEKEPASTEVIKKSWEEARESEKLLENIRTQIFDSVNWQIFSEADNWICPFCKFEVEGIDFKTTLSKKEIAPLQIQAHLLERCSGYKTGKSLEKPIADIKPDEKAQIDKVGAKTNDYRASLLAFKAIKEQEKQTQIQDAEQVITSEKNEYNRGMLEKAREIQMRMLPEIPNIENFEFFVHFASCDELSGDFYDFFWVSEKELGIVVGDVSGHGVSAALVMASVKKSLKIRGKGLSSPKEAIMIVNDDIKPELPMSVFITIFYGILNIENFTLSYIRAGHNPLYIYNPGRNPQFNEFKSKGMIIGAAPSNMLERVIIEETLQLYAGDLILQYTDGLTEAMNSKEEEYTEERFRDFIIANGDLSAEKFVQDLIANLNQHYAGAEPNDDVTILAIKIPPAT